MRNKTSSSHQYFVYVLKSLKDKKLYFGHTKNLDSRLKQHNAGKVLSTKFRRPFKLIGFKEYESRNEARWIEYEIKHHSDKKKKFLKDISVLT